MKQNATWMSARLQVVIHQDFRMATGGAAFRLQDGHRRCCFQTSRWPQAVLHSDLRMTHRRCYIQSSGWPQAVLFKLQDGHGRCYIQSYYDVCRISIDCSTRYQQNTLSFVSCFTTNCVTNLKLTFNLWNEKKKISDETEVPKSKGCKSWANSEYTEGGLRGSRRWDACTAWSSLSAYVTCCKQVTVHMYLLRRTTLQRAVTVALSDRTKASLAKSATKQRK
jgi:hypothetical protein